MTAAASDASTPGVHRSPLPDVDIPAISLPSHVLHRAMLRGDKPALIDGPSGRTLTFAQLARDVDRFAAGLTARGFGKGDVLAMFCPNVPEFAVAFYGVLQVGGVVSTVNPLSTAGELAGQLRDSRASLLLTVPALLPTAQAAARESSVTEIFVIGEADGALPYASLFADASGFTPARIDPQHDLAVLPYSSGTTGLPKGVMLTHHNLVAHDVMIDGFIPQTDADTMIAVLPFFHIYGMSVLMNAGLSRGTTIVTMPRFDLEMFLQLIQDQRVTVAYLAPPIVVALAKHPLIDSYDLSSLRDVFCGAAPLSAELQDACGARIGCKVVQGYGMTEASPVTHATPIGSGRVGSVGKTIRNAESCVVNPETGARLGPNERGELWVRGPNVMRGYLNRPDATAETIVEGGWLRTGDIAYVDDDGYFYVVDRLKELIKYKGYQVAPAELEALLLTHSSVADAAVIGAPDEEAGELPKAFVVRKAGVEIESHELMDWVAGQVAPYKRIRLLEFVDQVPKSASGKILRRVLIEQERERAAAARAEVAAPAR